MKNRLATTTQALLALLALSAATWLPPAAAAPSTSPPAQAQAGALPASAAGAAKAPKTAEQKALIDINSASARKLQTLPGISAETAKRIVAKRPYGSKSQLVTRGALDEPTFQSIRHLIIARQR